MLTRLARTLVAVSATALLLGNCASLRQDEQEAAELGPDFLAEGRLSIRKTGKQQVLARFTWARGYLGEGWTERISLFDAAGSRLLRVTSSPKATVAITPQRRYTSKSLQELLDDEIGLNIPPTKLARWLTNEHDGKPLPNKLRLEDTLVEVLERSGDERPVRLRIIHNDVIMLIAVTRFS